MLLNFDMEDFMYNKLNLYGFLTLFFLLIFSAAHSQAHPRAEWYENSEINVLMHTGSINIDPSQAQEFADQEAPGFVYLLKMQIEEVDDD